MKKRNFLAGLTALVMTASAMSGFTAFAEDTEVEVNPLAGISADFQNWSLNETGGIVSPEGEAWYKILERAGGNSSTIVTEADGNKYLQFNTKYIKKIVSIITDINLTTLNFFFFNYNSSNILSTFFSFPF